MKPHRRQLPSHRLPRERPVIRHLAALATLAADLALPPSGILRARAAYAEVCRGAM